VIFDQEKFLKVSESYTETKIQLTEDYPDGADGSRQAPVPSKENLDAEITNNQFNLTNISEQNLKDNVNNSNRQKSRL
jgi:hypothetical protein